MKYGTGLSMKKLSEDERAAQMVYDIFPEIKAVIGTNPAAGGMALKKLSQYAPLQFPEEKMQQLDAVLREYGKTKGLTPKEQEKVKRYQAMEHGRTHTAGQGIDARGRQDCFCRQVWLDTKGERIQAHGGAIFYEKDSRSDAEGLPCAYTYYWYGENKEFTDGESDIWTWGIRAYRSGDLYNWEDMGLIIGRY